MRWVYGPRALPRAHYGVAYLERMEAGWLKQRAEGIPPPDSLLRSIPPGRTLEDQVLSLPSMGPNWTPYCGTPRACCEAPPRAEEKVFVQLDQLRQRLGWDISFDRLALAARWIARWIRDAYAPYPSARITRLIDRHGLPLIERLADEEAARSSGTAT